MNQRQILITFVCLTGLAGCSSVDPKEQALRDTVSKVKAIVTNPQAKQFIVQESMATGMMTNMMSKMTEMANTSAAEAEQVTARLAALDKLSQQPDPVAATADGAASEPPPPQGNNDLIAAQNQPAPASALTPDPRFQAMSFFTQAANQGSKTNEEMAKEMTPTRIAQWLGNRGKTMNKMVDSVKGIVNSQPVDKKQKFMMGVWETSIKQQSPFPSKVFYGSPESPWCIVLKGHDAEHKLICEAYGADGTTMLFKEYIPITWH